MSHGRLDFDVFKGKAVSFVCLLSAKFGPLYLYPLLLYKTWHFASCSAAMIEIFRDSH